MKKPILNRSERLAIEVKTFAGAIFELKLKQYHLKRSIYREHGYIAMKLVEFRSLHAINKRYF